MHHEQMYEYQQMEKKVHNKHVTQKHTRTHMSNKDKFLYSGLLLCVCMYVCVLRDYERSKRNIENKNQEFNYLFDGLSDGYAMAVSVQWLFLLFCWFVYCATKLEVACVNVCVLVDFAHVLREHKLR